MRQDLAVFVALAGVTWVMVTMAVFLGLAWREAHEWIDRRFPPDLDIDKESWHR